MPGVPALVTRATDLPSRQQRLDLGARPLLVMLVEGDLRLLDLEVLEQQPGLAGILAGDTSTARRVSSARRVMSPRLPIGVATRYSMLFSVSGTPLDWARTVGASPPEEIWYVHRAVAHGVRPALSG